MVLNYFFAKIVIPNQRKILKKLFFSRFFKENNASLPRLFYFWGIKTKEVFFKENSKQKNKNGRSNKNAQNERHHDRGCDCELE